MASLAKQVNSISSCPVLDVEQIAQGTKPQLPNHVAGLSGMARAVLSHCISINYGGAEGVSSVSQPTRLLMTQLGQFSSPLDCP